MSDFIEIHASPKRIASRKPIYGYGINDANYYVINKTGRCPYFSRWYDMLKRCYSEVLHKKRPTYVGCITCEEWLTFSNFKAWMINQVWENNHLDKDIVTPNNKIYSPNNCRFISPELNMLLTDHGAARGEYPQGVNWHKQHKKFQAQINDNGSRKHIGYFEACEAARSAYVKFKTKILLEQASLQKDSQIAAGLRMHAELLNK